MQFKLFVFGSTACLGLLLTAATALPFDDDRGQTAAQPLNPAGEGRRVFLRENCYGCHGGRAGGGMGPNFRDDRPNSDDVEQAVREGKEGGMPPFPQLTELDIQNLEAYFKSLRSGAEPTFTHWWEPLPSQ
jgi:cytochrome c551